MFRFGFLVVFGVAATHLEMGRMPNEKAQRAQITDSEAIQMYQKWFDTGLSSVLAAVANQRLKRQRKNIAKSFGQCSHDAETLGEHAKCVSKLLKSEIGNRFGKKKSRIERLKKPNREWLGSFRQKRSPAVAAHSYDLYSSKSQITPMGSIARMLLSSVLAAKNKTAEPPSWHETISKLQRIKEIKMAEKKKLEEENSDEEKTAEQWAFRGIQRSLRAQHQTEVDIEAIATNSTKLSEFISKQKTKRRKSVNDRLMELVRDGMKLGYRIAGQNITNFDNKTMRLVSPRFLGVVPEERNTDEIDLLSPSLFSLHNQGSGLENLTSLPNLMKAAGLQDHEIFMNLILEAAGVNDETAKIEKEQNESLAILHGNRNHPFSPEKLIDTDGVPLYFTKENATKIGGQMERRKIEIFERLQKMYSKDQMREMNTTGMSTLSRKQLHWLYGPHSPYNNSEALRRLSSLTSEQMNSQILRDIHRMAEMPEKSWKIREKDVVLSPVVLTWGGVLNPALASQPIVLSPVLFTPLILSPSVFGAVILSPWMFVPLVLSPRVLGALILSPFVLSPMILTPVALHPAILAPGIFNPLILSPLALVPFILSPQVFTPIILCPLVLDPLILNPMVGSPLILSPFVLSPILGSPMALSALILSPYALSPVVASPLIAFTAILSPSWLSR